MKNKLILFTILNLVAMPFAGSAAPVRLEGAASFTKGMILPYKDAVEKASGATLAIVGNTTAQGLVSLSEGKCDICLASDTLETAVGLVKKLGKEVNPSDYQFHKVKDDSVVFIVNPSNPVQSLTLEQLKGIHSGKIANWKDVGGPDKPIVVFTEGPHGATRGVAVRAMMPGEDYAATCRVVENLRLVASSVVEFKNGIGVVSESFADPKLVKTLKTDKAITRPWGFITKGAPSADFKKVMDAYKAQAK